VDTIDVSQSNSDTAYSVIRHSTSQYLSIRGWQYHIRHWAATSLVADQPPLVMLHGYMDVAASFQFVVDLLPPTRQVISLDWRGFGETVQPQGSYTDSYWFPDYLGDLDAVLNTLFPQQKIDLLGHSMGGNIAMVYAGIRCERIRKLINLEGFGLPDTSPSQAPKRYQKWLDQLAMPKRLRHYDSIWAVAARMRESNPRLSLDKAIWLAAHWAVEHVSGEWHLRSDTAHKRVNPILYRDDDIAACRKLISAPTLWVDGAQSNLLEIFAGENVETARQLWQTRLNVVPQISHLTIDDCGHMIHHDQPQVLANAIEEFLR
jgi:pimeloyl-ACP methyl ester carboxylesterase